MSFDAVFSGSPQPPFPAASNAPALGFETNVGALWTSGKSGWAPVSTAAAKAASLGATANIASLLAFTAPLAGVYRVHYYAVSANTPGASANAAVPGATAAFTEGDTSGSITSTVVAATASTVVAENIVNQGSVLVNAKAGSTITVATTGYVAGSGTALSYNAKARIEFLG